MVNCSVESVQRNKSIITWLFIIFIAVLIVLIVIAFLGFYVFGLTILSMWWIFLVLIGFLIVILIFIFLVKACEEPQEQSKGLGKKSGGKHNKEAEEEL